MTDSNGKSQDPGSSGDPGDATQFLLALTDGDEAAPDRLLPLVYTELRNLADGYLRGERADHTLQPTALLHEAWLRLIDQSRVDWQNRAHFIGIAAMTMRRVLVDHARARKRAKRGGGAEREELHSGIHKGDLAVSELDVLALNEGLDRLAEKSERAGKIVELRFFGGLTNEEIARMLGVTVRTVERDWSAARAWLTNWLRSATGDEE